MRSSHPQPHAKLSDTCFLARNAAGSSKNVAQEAILGLLMPMWNAKARQDREKFRERERQEREEQNKRDLEIAKRLWFSLLPLCMSA